MIETVNAVTIAALAIDLDSPIFQFFGAVTGGIIMILAWLQGQKVKMDDPPRGGGVQVYYDGPTTDVLGQVKRMADGVQQALLALPSTADLREEFTEKMARARHDVNDKLQEHNIEWEKDHDDIERRLREAEGIIARLDERLKSVEGRPPRRS